MSDKRKPDETIPKDGTGRPPGKPFQWVEAFLEALRKNANVSESCRAVDVNRMTVYEHRKRDPEFAKRWADAIEEAVDELELKAWQRAKVGRKVPVYHQGIKTAEHLEVDNGLLKFLLKAYRPDKFKERQHITGGLGVLTGEIPAERLKGMSDEDLRRIAGEGVAVEDDPGGDE